MSTIDVHAHYYPPPYVERLGKLTAEVGAAGDMARRFFANTQVQEIPAFTGALDDRVRLLDRVGIETQMLSFASMNVYHPEATERAGLAAAFNDGCSEAAVAFPGRFRFFATMPVPFVDAAIRESKRARLLDGFAGFNLPTHINGMPIDDPRLGPLYSEWNTTPTLVLLHPDGFCAPGTLADHSMEWGLGAPFEDTIAAVRLLRSGLLERFPNITWIVPHLGGVLPFLWHRLEWRWNLDALFAGGPQLPAMSMSRLLIDTANSSSATIELATTQLPGATLVFGSDYPFLDANHLERAVKMVRASQEPASAQRIFRATMERHLSQVQVNLTSLTPESGASS